MKIFEIRAGKTKEQKKSYRFWRFKIILNQDTCTHYDLLNDLWLNRIFPHFYFQTKKPIGLIKKIKCHFGFHKWSEPSLSQSGSYDQYCKHGCRARASDGDIYENN